MTSPMPAGQGRPRLQVINGEGVVLDGEWASGHWDAGRLGIPARRGRGTARFGGIGQPWLREPVKRWSRFRLATGCAFATIDAGALALTRFSRFPAARQPDAGDASAITRPVLEDYLSWLVTQGYPASTRALSLSMIRVFSGACHRHGWLPGLAASATIYVEELPFHHDQIARFIPEFVMAQLESEQALSKIPYTTTRHLVVVVIETGLRGGDACNLPFNPVLTDSSGWPCLRFEAVKIRSEQLIPLSAKAAAAIGARQDYVRERWPAGSPWLFPGMTGNDDGHKPCSHRTFSQQPEHWQRAIDLRDEAGQPVIVTGHQFRHTLGTRLINSGVPQHVVQKLLGHASPHMTSHYAKVPRPRQPPQRLLRPPGPAGLPAPECLPHLPGLPDHAPVPADPPAAGRHQQPPDRPGRRQRPAPPRREPAPRPGQPGTDHPRPRSTPRRRSRR